MIKFICYPKCATFLLNVKEIKEYYDVRVWMNYKRNKEFY